MKRLLEFKNVTITINDEVLYNDLNLVINEGDRFIFLGPNGVGKSLLLKLISLGYSRNLQSEYKGLNVKGQILDKSGNDLLDPSVARKHISYSEQMDTPYNNTTILEEAETACAGSEIDLDEAKLDHLLDTFNLSKKKKKRIKDNVSGGEGKLIQLITRILKLQKADILILDEPLNHLSFENSRKFNDVIIEEIKENPNLAIIMVSHCRAANFTDKALVYDKSSKTLKIVKYSAYDCFSDDFCSSLCL
ncbi:ATP-binding cassette domain-containing protein [Ruminococcus albus]|uniref:Iron complex transport system ATP-binding protein n=1 Tax=Ruminococcus albus TaxID=1264 RepID=A0A1I1L6A4_RUMAL|nr:ATP-binding cassette domain-containing protein [Ruminococcus albus]SFC66528.1 iron complex transport system ATP-binding protein [Ruminococcus albus]